MCICLSPALHGGELNVAPPLRLSPTNSPAPPGPGVTCFRDEEPEGGKSEQIIRGREAFHEQRLELVLMTPEWLFFPIAITEIITGLLAVLCCQFY